MYSSHDLNSGTSERGRPREFDRDAVIAAAVEVFRAHGYHATSIEDLCQATGLLRGSLYGAFGDKRGIFLAALDRYSEIGIARLADRLNVTPFTRETMREALLYYVRFASGIPNEGGCLVISTAMELIPDDLDVANRIERNMRRMAALLAAAVVRGQVIGIFNKRLDERAVGNFLLCMTYGLRILGNVIADKEELSTAVDTAIKVLD
jgi:TetR/AcrR family transcriptional repressor of nem operon